MKKLFYLLLALPLAFVACDDPDQGVDEPQVKDPVLKVVETTIDFAAKGGNGDIHYVVENAVEGTNVEATCEAQWVSDINVAEKITFAVAANEETEARETTIVVAYGELSKSVTINQEAKAEAPAVPKLEAVESTVEYAWDVTSGEVAFTLENPIAGVEVTAKTSTSWISQVQVKDGKILFAMEKNMGEAREGKITAEYGMLEPIQFTVKQSAYVAPDPVLTVDNNTFEFDAEGGNGSFTYTVENPVAGVVLEAEADVEWITEVTVADGNASFAVAKNEGDLREGKIILTYGNISAEVVVKQLPSGYDPNMNYSIFGVIETWADLKQEGKQWNVTFVEHHDILGDMQTTISFYNEEANIQHLNSGSYSVANGGILVNSFSQNGFSIYRGNSSDAADIADANFEVKADTDAHIITIEGAFKVGNNIITLNYTGEIRGMDISEPANEAINITDWKTFTGKYWNGYDDDSEFMFQGRSTDGSVEIMFDCYAFPRVTDKIAPEGTYTIAPWEAKDNYQGDSLYVMDQSTITYNTIKGNLSEGTLTIEHISGGYTITFDFIDTLGRHFTGSYSGALTAGSTVISPTM